LRRLKVYSHTRRHTQRDTQIHTRRHAHVLYTHVLYTHTHTHAHTHAHTAELADKREQLKTVTDSLESILAQMSPADATGNPKP